MGIIELVGAVVSVLALIASIVSVGLKIHTAVCCIHADISRLLENVSGLQHQAVELWHTIRRHEDRLDGHDTRLTVLETER